MANGIIGKGTTLGAGATSTTTPIANMMDVNQPDEKYGKVETTEYADTIEQFIAGWKNAGEVEFMLGFNKTSYAANRAYLGVNSTFWKITLPLAGAETTASTIAFQGCLFELGGPIPIKGKVTVKAKIFLQSDVVFTAGS